MYPYYLYSDTPRLSAHKVWAEIDSKALADNYKTLCALNPEAAHICVVKADAYGHTARLCVKTLLDSGCRFFAVSCIEEALAVRDCCDSADAEILILGYTVPSQAEILAKNNIIQTVISEEYAQRLHEVLMDTDCRLRVHVALDTGMNRVGICARNSAECRHAVDFIDALKQKDTFSVEGIFTHFAQADEEYSLAILPDSRTHRQFANFDKVRSALAKRDIVLFSHACNSAAAMRFPQYSLDGVRLGIALYGVAPSHFFERITAPVMSLYTVVSHIHSVPVGEKVSYGGSFAPETERTVATLPIGYADGFSRAFKGFSVTVHTSHGKYKAPVVGNICMDQCMIDITDLPVSVGDKVTLFGNDPDDITRLADLAGTIEYEILCSVSARVPRVLKQDNTWEDQL